MRKDKNVYVFLILFFLLVSGLSLPLQAQPMEIRPYLFSSFDIRNQNWDISQDPENHVVYFANSEGLIRYNGIVWEKFTDKEQMPVRSVKVHPGGDIFTGSFEDFGFWRYSDRGELQYHSLVDDGLIEKNDEIWNIFIHEGNVYFQSFTSIYIYDFSSVRKVKAPYTMLFMHRPGERFIVQIFYNGLFWFEDDEFIFIENSQFLAHKKVHAIIPYDEGRYMVCTDGDGLYLFDGEDFEYFDSEASDFLKQNSCNAAKKLGDGSFAFGSILNGLITTDEQGRITRRYNTDNGLGNNTVLSLYLCAEKGLWVGMDQGVNYIDLLSPITRYKSKNGSFGTIYALLEHKEWLYVGTNIGLFRTKMERRGAVYHFHHLEFIPGSQGQVWSLLIHGDQIICGHNDGTFLVKEGRMEQISGVSGGWSYIVYDDYILGGTYTGIIVLEKDPAGRIVFRNKLGNYAHPARYLETDYLGYVWASHHQRGIYRVELSAGMYDAEEVVHYPEIDGKSFNIRVFKINNRIVFTTSEDIYTFDFVRNEIIPFTALTDHLGEYSKAFQINHHDKNQYWFIKEDKMALFEVRMDFSVEMIMETGYEGINLPQRNIQLAFLDEHTILIPNPHHFDAYNLLMHDKRADTTMLAIERLRFYGDKDSLYYYCTFDNIKVPWHANNLTVCFRNPSQWDWSNKTFEYRISEMDAAWQKTTGNQFTYLDLDHGRYTLEIRANDGHLIRQPFVVSKPWFYSHGALVVYVGLFFMLVWALYLFFRFEIKRHKNLVLMELRQNNLERELDYKSQELMFTMRHLIRKDNILNNLQNLIDAIKEQYARYPVKHIKKMEKIIRESLGYQNIEWENAAQNLKLSQQGFFKVLKDKYPDLTPNDLRLCAYLRLNLSTKEIAQLLNISNRGVEISRHRLRKKLNIKKDEHLYEFLMREEFSFSNEE